MGHRIHYGIFTEEDREKGRIAEWADACYADGHDWDEDPFGTFRDRIEYHNRAPLPTEDDAWEWIDKAAEGKMYCSCAVRFKDIERMPAPRRVEAARERANRLREEADLLSRKPHFAGHKAALIGCRSCGSKIASAHMGDRNRCPVCGDDMRPQSVLSALEKKRERRDAAIAECKKIEHEWARDMAEKAPVRWAVRIEYHC